MTKLAKPSYDNIPAELKQLNQWAIAGPDKSPYLLGQNGLYRASVSVNGSPWMDFNSARNYAEHYNLKIGFIITPHDPFTCVDLDVKDAFTINGTGKPVPKEQWTTPEKLNEFSGIVQLAQSYSELSASNKGVHVWLYGNIGGGRRKDGIEIYSADRFIICTGNVVSELQYRSLNNLYIPNVSSQKPNPIIDGKHILDILLSEIETKHKEIALVETPEEYDDNTILERAKNADNKNKFDLLTNGKWAESGYKSNSEADMALMSMFTFYSKSNEQCKRLFRQTPLAQRKKVMQDDVYINRTLQTIRNREAAEEEKNKNLTALMEEKAAAGMMQHINNPAIYLRNDVVPYIDQTSVIQNPQSNLIDYSLPNVPGIDWPPGFVGALAGFMFRSAPRPVKEIAVISALGLMAGILGKSYHISHTGLNLYLILLAKSGVGKEALTTGIGHLRNSQCGPMIAPFITFDEYVSGPALSRAVGKSNSMIHVSGEFGRKLKQMADERSPTGPMHSLRTVMTHLYQKSGIGSIVGAMQYSNEDKNTESANGVAYSMLCESTPGTFNDSLTKSMMEDGFLSRFNVVEYTGDRVPLQENREIIPPKELTFNLGEIAAHSVRVAGSHIGIKIELSSEAEKILKEFDLYCDNKINEADDDESERQLWNRAHIKALRISGILAASDNHSRPLVTYEHALWGTKFVFRDAQTMLSKIRGGDIGKDDDSRLKIVLTILKEYRQKVPSPGYKVPTPMWRKGIIPHGYLQKRTMQKSSFYSHMLGATKALELTVKSLVDSGHLTETSKSEMQSSYHFYGKCYYIIEVD